jgi:hypothetical protein
MSLLAIRAVHLFVAFTSADGYKKLLSHLGPDPKVCYPIVCDPKMYLDTFLQDKSLFLVTLGPKLPCQFL